MDMVIFLNYKDKTFKTFYKLCKMVQNAKGLFIVFLK